MKGKVFGVKRLDYISKKTSAKVQGYSVGYGLIEDGTVGYSVKSEFFNDERFASTLKQVGGDFAKLVGREADFVFNQYGHVSQIALVAAG